MALEQLSPLVAAIEQEIESHLNARLPLAEKVSEYILKSGGKKVRPLLFVLAANLCGAEIEAVIRLSPIFEYLHVATLLHDDVIDGASLRRGKPAANVVWGNTIAILVGDFLLASALELAASSGNLQMVRELSKTTSWLAQGELHEILKTDDLDLSEEEYFQIIEGKTAVLIAAATKLGALIAGGTPVEQQALETYGHRVGLAFQIVDDVLDYVVDSSQLGKPAGHDLIEGKVTLPLIYALKDASPQERDEIKNRFSSRQKDDLTAIVNFVKDKQGTQKALQKAKELIAEAKSALDVFEEHPTKVLLLELADFIWQRKH